MELGENSGGDRDQQETELLAFMQSCEIKMTRSRGPNSPSSPTRRRQDVPQEHSAGEKGLVTRGGSGEEEGGGEQGNCKTLGGGEGAGTELLTIHKGLI
jgi:hypothetical protein